jgi:hypothetical protein
MSSDNQVITIDVFGTFVDLVKLGYNHTNLTGLEKVNGEQSLIMLVYKIKCSSCSRSDC